MALVIRAVVAGSFKVVVFEAAFPPVNISLEITKPVTERQAVLTDEAIRFLYQAKGRVAYFAMERVCFCFDLLLAKIICGN